MGLFSRLKNWDDGDILYEVDLEADFDNLYKSAGKMIKGADVASVTALNLGDDGRCFDITGTTTITSISTLEKGAFVLLHFDGILTLTHHATNLVLPGGTNITTAAGDEGFFYEYDTGMWRCVGYSPPEGNGEGGGGLDNVVEDLTPQLGGNLDMNGKTIGGNSEAQLDDAVAKKHAEAHTIASHSSKAHSELTGVTSDLHHPQIHNAASHSDIASSGADIDDAVTKKHAAGSDTALGAQAENLDMNTHKIVGVVDPSGPQDAATKAYGDANWGGGGGLPVVDTTIIVEGSVDDTKKMRFEVDGLTTENTRVLTPQDKDYTIADHADIAAKVAKTTFDANSILKADSDNTPVKLTVGEQTLLGRITAGVIAALTPAQVRTLIDVASGATKYPDTGEQAFSDADHTKLNSVATDADVTGANSPQGHEASHENGGSDEINVGGLSGLLADDQHVLDTEVKAAVVSDEAYAAGWNDVTDVAPSKNTIYDKIETLGGGGDVTAAANIDANAIVVGDDGAKGVKKLAFGAADLKLFMNAAGNANEYANGMKIRTSTRDTAIASGTQDVTGIGFKPSNVILLTQIANTFQGGIGFDDGTNHHSVYNRGAAGAGLWGIESGKSVYLRQSADTSIYYTGYVSAFGSDGFTITWTKVGAKTGTVTLYILAFR